MPHAFTDVDPDHPPHSLATVLRWAVVDRLLGRRTIRDPGPPAPRVEPDLELLARPADAPRVTWIGHSSFLIQLAGRSILIDPVFSSRVGTYPRHAPPGVDLEQLPPIDLLLVTHSHYDHLDDPSVRALRQRAGGESTRVVVPAGLGRWFETRGFSQVEELRWWEAARSTAALDLRVDLVPARHWSRRGPFDLNDTLWGGWVVESASESTGGSVFHAGDTAWFPEAYDEIGRRFDLDVALLPIGAYDPGWFMEHAHATPEQAGELFRRLGARIFVPMHWGTFQLTDEPISEPLERLEAWWRHARPAGRLETLPLGGNLEL